jgi:hypothetical protein
MNLSNLVNIFFLAFRIFTLVATCSMCSVHSQQQKYFSYTSMENKEWTLRVWHLTAKTIEYDFSELLQSALPKQCAQKQSAKNSLQGDPGVDSDSDGLAYPVDEYIFDDGICYIGIRINSIDQSRLTLVIENAPVSKRGEVAPIVKVFLKGGRVVK